MISCLSVCLSVCPSVRLSVTLVDCDHMRWNSSEIILRLNSSRGRSQGVPKIFRAPTYRAHCAVIFAIAQLWAFTWSSSLTLHIEIYTASRGFPATARLLFFFLILEPGPNGRGRAVQDSTVELGKAHFTSIRRVSSDAVTLQCNTCGHCFCALRCWSWSWSWASESWSWSCLSGSWSWSWSWATESWIQVWLDLTWKSDSVRYKPNKSKI